MKPSYKDLYNREDRAKARLALMAQANAIGGGAGALVLAKRLDRMGCNFSAEGVVSRVWACGRIPRDLAVCECDECGNVHLGQDAADECCAPQPEWEPGWGVTVTCNA